MNTKPPRPATLCLNQDFENLKYGEGDSAKKIHQVLKCKACNIYWNRDTMAPRNMFPIAHSICNGQGRPIVFKRQLATSNVVALSHSSVALVGEKQ